jgi:hypothetical protein
MNETTTLMSDRRTVQQNSGDTGFVTRRVAGETIVVPVSSRVGDLDSIYTLNEVGARVWTLLETPTSVQDILATLCDEYDARRDQIETDLIELLDTLQSNGLVRFAEGSRA